MKRTFRSVSAAARMSTLDSFPDQFECYWNESYNTLECLGEVCTFQGYLQRGVAMQSGVLSDSPLGNYACGNGCTITVSGWNGATAQCGNGSATGGFNNGNQGGGGGGNGTLTPAQQLQNFLNSLTAEELAAVQGMNALEWAKCEANYAQCAVWARHSAVAISLSILLTIGEPASVQADFRNALRHGFWQGLLPYDLGELEAEQWAAAHENGNPPDPTDTCRDLINNQIARNIGAQVKMQYPFGGYPAVETAINAAHHARMFRYARCTP